MYSGSGAKTILISATKTYRLLGERVVSQRVSECFPRKMSCKMKKRPELLIWRPAEDTYWRGKIHAGRLREEGVWCF